MPEDIKLPGMVVRRRRLLPDYQAPCPWCGSAGPHYGKLEQPELIGCGHCERWINPD